MSQVLVLNGPNLNLLGRREPERYGTATLGTLESGLSERAAGLDITIDFYQSNSESALIDRIHRAVDEPVRFIIINPAALTHTSIALRDALLGVALPFIEVHISNVHRREAFRQHSYFSDIAEGTIVGLGVQGYSLALDAAHDWLVRHPVTDR